MENKLVQERINKLNVLREKGINPYPQVFNKKNNSKEISEKYKKLGKEAQTKDKVSIAGRIMTMRQMGKASFAHIQDQEGKWYLSKTAQKQYCSQYGLDAVDTDCLEHLCAEMRNKTLSESTITTPVLAMKREGRIIKEIHIRLTGVRNSLSLDDP